MLKEESLTTHSSSLFSLSSGTLKLESTSLDFSNRFVSPQPLFSQNGGSLAVSGMSIENVTRSSGDGSVISSTISSGSLSISDCSFSSCSTAGNGGVMKVVLSGTATFTVTGSTTFSSCSASGNGNFVHLTCSDLVSFLKGSSASGPLSAIRPTTESGVAFSSDVHEQFWGSDTKAGSLSSGSLLFYWYPHTTGPVRVAETGTNHIHCGEAELPCSSLSFGHDRLKESGKEVILSSAASLSTSLKPIFAAETITSLSTAQTVTLSSEGQIKTDTANTVLTLKTLDFVLDSSQARTLSVFSVSAGSLIVSGCTFGSSTTTTSLTSSIVSVSGGTFQMIDNCVIQNMSSAHPILSLVGGTTRLVSATVRWIALTSCSAIVVNDGNLELKDSSFSMISNSEGDGSVLRAVVKSGRTVSIVSGTISDCWTKGNGGAVHVTLVGTGSVEMKGASGIQFERCSAVVDSSKAVNSTGLGQCVFISAEVTSKLVLDSISFPTVSDTNPAPFLFVSSPSLNSVVTTTSFAFLSPFEFNTDDLGLYSGYDGGIQSVTHPLIIFLLDLSRSYVGAAGNDSLECGVSLLPCETVTRATERLVSEGSAKMEIIIVDSGILNSTLAIDGISLLVTSADKKVVNVDGGLFDMSTKATDASSLTMRNLELCWNGKGSQLLELSKGTSKMAACSLSMVASSGELFSCALVKVGGGVLVIEDLTFSGEDNWIRTFVLTSGGSTTLDGVSISNGKLLSSPISGTGSVTLVSSSMKSLDGSESSDVSALRLTLSTSSSLTIGGESKPVSFISCSSKGNGGALNIALLSSGALKISHTSFTSCSSAGNGGALAVSLSASALFSITGASSFTSCTASGKGSKLYLSRPDLLSFVSAGNLDSIKPALSTKAAADSILNEFYGFESPSSEGSLLFYWYPFSTLDTTMHVHSSGHAHSLCGKEALPCKTLPDSLNKIQSATTLMIDTNIELPSKLTSLASEWKLSSSGLFKITLTSDGQIESKDDQSNLTVSSLSLDVGTLSSERKTELVSVSAGLLVLSSCTVFSSTSNLPVSFVALSGGVVSMTSTTLNLPTIQSKPVISVIGGKLEVDSSASFVNSGTASHKVSLVSIGGGTVVLEGSTLTTTQKLTLASSALMTQSKGSLTISNMKIQNVSRAGGDGSVVSSTLAANTDELSIISTTFKLCSCSAGNGGALFVSLSASALFSITGTSSFTSCTASGKGSKLYLSRPDLVSFMSTGNLDSIKPTLSTKAAADGILNEFYGFESSSSEGSLLFYWYPFSTLDTTMHVHSSGHAHSLCGKEALPCKTLSDSLSNIQSATTLMIDTNIELPSKLTSIPRAWTLTKSGSAVLTFVADGQIALTDSASQLTLSSFLLAIGTLTTNRQTAIVTVTTGSLAISSCTVSTIDKTTAVPFLSVNGGSASIGVSNTFVNPSVTSSLFAVSAGSLSITSPLSVTHLSDARSAALFDLSGGTTTLSSSLKSLFSSGTVFSMKTGSILNLNTVSDDFNLAKVSQLAELDGGRLVVTGSFTKGLLSSSFISGHGTLDLGASFTSFSPQSTSNAECRLLTLTILKGETVQIGSSTNKVMFDSCSSSEDGGVLHATLQETGALSLTNTTFAGCSSNGNGGAIFVDLASSTLPPSISLTSVSFGDVTAGTGCSAQNGQALYCVVASGKETTSLETIRDALLPSSPSTPPAFSSTERTLVEFGDGSLVGSVLYPFHPTTTQLSLRGDVGFDHPLCGNTLLPCQSLKQGYSNIPVLSDTHSLMLDTPLTLNEKLSTEDKTVNIAGSVSNNLKLGSAAELDVKAGELVLSSLTVVLPKPLTKSVFVVSSTGKLHLTSTSVIEHSGSSSTPTVLPSPLFSVTGGSLTIEGTEASPQIFEFFEGSSVIKALSTNQLSLTLSHCHFLSCVSPDNGVISLEGENDGKLLMNTCFFENNSGSKSNDLFASAGWIGALTNQTILSSYSESNMDHAVIGDKSMNDLIPYSVLKVHPTLGEHACAMPSVPCPSIVRSLELCIQTEKDNKTPALRKIEMQTDVKESTTLVVGMKRIELSASSKEIELTWDSSDSMMTITTGSVLLRSFVLVHLHPASTTPLLLMKDAGTLKLSSIEFDGQNETFTSQLIAVEDGHLQIASSSFSAMQMESSALIESDGVVEIESCTFSDITRSTLNATVVHTTSEKGSVSVKQTKFLSCFGGSEERWVELTDRNPTALAQASWEGTFNVSSPIRGVAVNSASKVGVAGYNPFSLLYEWYPREGSAIVVSSEKSREDHPLCGGEVLACLTVNEGMRLTTQRTVVVIGKGRVDGEVVIENRAVSISGENGKDVLAFVENGQLVSVSGSDAKTTLADLVFDVSLSLLVSPAGVFELGGGTLSVSQCSLISSSSIKMGLFVMNENTLKVNDLKLDSLNFSASPFVLTGTKSVSLQNLKMNLCTVGELISSTDVEDLSIEYSSFVGVTQPLSTNTEGLCEWNAGLLRLVDSQSTIRFTSFQDLDDGALFVENSTLTIESSTFHDNTPNDPTFTSVHRNVRCVGQSKLTVASLSGGDGLESESMWISAEEDCEVWTNKTRTFAPFFVPKLNKKESKCTQNKKEKSFTFSLSGSLFVPCGLKLNLFEVKNNENLKQQSIDLTTISTTKWTESKMEFVLPLSSITLNSTFEWHGRLEYGEGEVTSEWIIVKISASDERKAQAKNIMKWLGPVIGAVSALLLFLLILTILLRRRHKQRTEQKAQEMKAKEEIDTVDEKYGIIEDFHVIGATTRVIDAGHQEKTFIVESDVSGYTKLPGEERLHLQAPKAEVVEVLKVEEGVEIVCVEKKNTLYSMLHGQNHAAIDKIDIQKKIVLGLARLAKLQPNRPIFTRLNPHWIFFDEKGQPHFKLNDDVAVPSAPPRRNLTQRSMGVGRDAVEMATPEDDLIQPAMIAHTGNSLVSSIPHIADPTDGTPASSFFAESPAVRAAGRQETMRWQAPEVANNARNVDAQQCAVFSLGVLLWEIETGLVPFGEIDASNASRQLCSGLLPKMDGVKDDDLKSLIEECLHLNPSERPSLDTVAAHFEPKGQTGTKLFGNNVQVIQ